MTGQAKSRSTKGAANKRSAARTGVVQALYQMDMAGSDVGTVIHEFTTHRFAGDDSKSNAGDNDESALADEALRSADPLFFRELLRGVVRRQTDIDPMVDQQLASGWRLGRVDSILRAILRAGSFELIERHDVPARVIINEYVNVAHAFFDDDEPRVVNGVLDRLARKLRVAEFSDGAVAAPGEEPGAAEG